METEFIHWLRAHLPTHPRLAIGLGDDAAVVRYGRDANVVVTTDLLTEGVDYFLAKDDPRKVGRKALAANLSDLAAMAARPVAAFISIAFPRQPTPAGTALELAIGLYEGMLPLAEEYELVIAGGDTNSYDGPLVISATLLGEVTDRGPLTRSGGRPGDWLLVTGELGGTILGHSFDFTPRVREALQLHERYELHAGMDLSDGLALDASRMAAESGCGAVLFPDRVPIAAAAHTLAAGETHELDKPAAALRHALGDGEDFELLLAASSEVAASMLRDRPLACGLTHVGELIAESGLWQQPHEFSSEKVRSPLEPIGWLH
jgi:thiamine-monophosphate kinase